MCVRLLAGLSAMTHFPSVCSQTQEHHFHHVLTLNPIYSVPWEFVDSGLNYLMGQCCTHTHTHSHAASLRTQKHRSPFYLQLREKYLSHSYGTYSQQPSSLILKQFLIASCRRHHLLPWFKPLNTMFRCCRDILQSSPRKLALGHHPSSVCPVGVKLLFSWSSDED